MVLSRYRISSRIWPLATTSLIGRLVDAMMRTSSGIGLEAPSGVTDFSCSTRSSFA